MRPDFSDLYSQLDLQPDCSLEDLKRAYQRRVARLHPDRPDAVSPGINLSLAELIALYGAATRFHRRHGRLPGATPRRTGKKVRVESAAHWPTHTRNPESRPAGAAFPPGIVLAVVLLAALLAVVASWDWSLMSWRLPLASIPRAAAMEPAMGASDAARPATIASATAQLQIDWDVHGLLPVQASPRGPVSPLPSNRSLDEACTPVPGRRRVPSLLP